MIVSIKVKKWQSLQMKLKDERQKMTNEVMNGVKVIKLYAWEKPMLKVISEIRSKEVALIRKASMTRTFIDVINSASPFLVSKI
uniref:ABC transmembrane type-1 domain-containing protein n=1 Tax=Panagrolaimus davidi TaxID=227884 RepID=A0A914Q7W4_9BILA